MSCAIRFQMSCSILSQALLIGLARLRVGPAREACRMVMVDGASVPDSARATGMEYRVAHQAVTRAKAAYALALAAAGVKIPAAGTPS